VAYGRFSLWRLTGHGRHGGWPSLDAFLCLEFMRKIFRPAYELFPGGVLGGSLRVSRKDVQGGGCRFGGGQIFRTRAENCAILPIRQFNSFAFVALLARVKPGKFY